MSTKGTFYPGCSRTQIRYKEQNTKHGKAAGGSYESKVKFNPKNSCNICNRSLFADSQKTILKYTNANGREIQAEKGCVANCLGKLGIKTGFASLIQARSLLLEYYYKTVVPAADSREFFNDLLRASDKIFDNPTEFFCRSSET